MTEIVDILIENPTEEVQHGPYIYKVLEDEVYYTMNWPNRREYIWYKHSELTALYELV